MSKEKIIKEIQQLPDEQLRSLEVFLEQLENQKTEPKEFLKFAGILPKDEADKMKQIIESEFNHKEGIW